MRQASIFWPILVVASGSFDSIVGQIQAATLGPYNFMKTSMNCVMYLVVYCIILILRYAAGIIPRRQLHFMYSCKLDTPLSSKSQTRPKAFWDRLGAWKFLLLAGVADLINELLGFAAQPYVKGIVNSIMSQGTIIFIVFWSFLLLQARYNMIQCIGLFVAIGGSVMGALGSNWLTSDPVYACLLFLKAVPSGLSFVLKEKAFRNYETWQKTTSMSRPLTSESPLSSDRLDVFVVCSAAGVFQFLAGPLLMPLSSQLTNTEHIPLNQWWSDGWTCFLNTRPSRPLPELMTNMPHLCTSAWQLYLLYAASNALFNISIYFSILNASSTFTFLAIKLVAPIATFLFLIDWPLIGQGRISLLQVLALVFILCGVFLFKFGESSCKNHSEVRAGGA